MSSVNNNNNNEANIEKFEGTFDKEEFGVAIIPTKTINEIRDMAALGVYVYLLSRPKDWKINVKQLKEHFQCGRDKMRDILNFLLNEKFITCTKIKKNNLFTRPHYRVHLSRFSDSRNLVDFGIDQSQTHASTESFPEPDFPAPESQAPENTAPYISYIVNNIEKDKNPYVDSKKSTEGGSYKSDLLFMQFYGNYPNKEKPRVAYKAFLKLKPTPDFVAMLVADVKNRMENNWNGRDKNKIPFPATYLNAHEWEGDIYKNTAPSSKTKIKSWDEITSSIMDGVL
jgi:hypothetical protein